jgi:DNA relaxase NicK
MDKNIMSKKLASRYDNFVQVVIFDANKYPNGQDDFIKAIEADDVDILDIDEDSYTMFYNISQSINGAAELLGGKIHLGTCKNDVFISISEMDCAVTEMGEEVQWDNRQSGFEAGLAYRKQEEDKEFSFSPSM